MDELHEDSLVLKHITLGLKIEVVIQMAIDLLVLSVLLKQPSEDSHAPNPEHFDGHSRVGRSLPLSRTGVSALTPGLSVLANAGSRVDGHRLSDNEAVFDKFADVLS